MMTAFLSILVFLYAAFLILGASLAVGRLFAAVTRGAFPDSYRLPLGFALLPVLVTYGGFIGIWRIPFLTPLCGIVSAVYGVGESLRWVRSLTWSALPARWRSFSVPLAVLLMLLGTKWVYLWAGWTHSDELRSIAFVSVFASNALKPGYLFNVSWPVSYPYYLFQTAAFAYRAVGGFLYPTIPLFVVTLFAILLTYRVLSLVCEHLSPDHAGDLFSLTALIFTFSGLGGYRVFLGDWFAPIFVGTVQSVVANLHSGYHYFWGVGLAALAITHLWLLLQSGETGEWRMALLLLTLGFCFAGIPVLWVGAGVVILLLLFCVQYRLPGLWLLLRDLPVSLLLFVGVFAPQVFNLAPRVVPVFSLSLPHLWYLRDIEVLLEQTGPHLALLKRIALGPVMITRGVGILLFASLFVSLFLSIRDIRKGAAAPAVFPFCVTVAAALLLLTCTKSITSDWYARGLIGPTILGSIVMASVLRPLLRRGVSVISLIVVVILTVQAGSFALEQWGRKSRIPQGFAEIARLNRTYPLGTVFYRREYDETAHRVLLAGRTIITFPPDPLYAYLISPKFLKETLGLHAAFLPCMESWYGENTPEGRFIFLQEGGEPVVSCADMPSLIQG